METPHFLRDGPVERNAASLSQRCPAMDDFQNGKQVFQILKLGTLVPVYVGTSLGVSLAAPKAVPKMDGFQNGEFSEFSAGH